MHTHLPLTLGDIFETNARFYPDEPAWIYEGRQLTHSQLLRRSRQLAHACERLGVKRQDRISMLAMNTLEYAEVYTAGWTSGIIVATVNFRLAPLEMHWIINDSSPKVLIFEAQYLPTVDALRAQLTSVEHYVCIGASTNWAQSYEDFVATGDAGQASFRAVEEDIALILYTSGTTGRPKGCILGQRELRQEASYMAMELHNEPQERGLIMMPFFHLGAMLVGLALSYRGVTVVMHRQFDPAAVVESLEKDRIHMTHLAPVMVQMLLAQPGVEQRDFSNMHTILYSAAPMPVTVLNRGLEIFGNVFVNMYGQTEVASTILPKSFHRPNGTEREKEWLKSVGRPFMNTEIKVVDDHGQPCPTGDAGEVWVKTTAMCRGYWNNSAATLETITDGWCHTGDIGRLDADGMLYLVDRKKDVINSGGENIYSREVEEAVLQHAAVSEVAVIGVPDAKWGEAVCAVVTLKPGATLTEVELIEHTKTLIASYKKPRHVRVVPELPKLPTGKINKVALRKSVVTD